MSLIDLTPRCQENILLNGWRHSQVVRQGPAKPPYPGSNPGAAFFIFTQFHPNLISFTFLLGDSRASRKKERRAMERSILSRYSCENLKRFSQKNLAFKRISEELGFPWFKLWMERMLENYKNGLLGPGVKTKGKEDARAYIAFWAACSSWNRLTSPYGEGHENMGLLSWSPVSLPPPLLMPPEEAQDPGELTARAKKMARLLGAVQVGVAKLEEVWVYKEVCRNIYEPGNPDTKPIVFKDVEAPQETEEELIIPRSFRYAIVMLFDMDYRLLSVGNASVLTSAATNMGYSKMGITEIALSEAIRAWGYNAIPCKNGVALSIPLAVSAGLGELGRNGLLVNKKLGSAVRIGKVLTDMPLVPDSPRFFGVMEFCEKCKRCVEVCEAGAISHGERTLEPPVDTGNPGALKWYIDGKACLNYWIKAGASCSACQVVCPFNRKSYKKMDPEILWEN